MMSPGLVCDVHFPTPSSLGPRLPMTPPPGPVADLSPLSTALAVLAAERDGLAHLHHLYSTDEAARRAFATAVDAIGGTVAAGGKVVVCGVGKSGLIGKKIVATLNSLGVPSACLHPTEALHGDLGMIGSHDTLLLLTFSGATPELLALLPHLPSALPLLTITSSRAQRDHPLFAGRPPPSKNVLLPASIPVSEATAFGVPAPTVSTTVALALGDALAMAVAQKLHASKKGGVGAVFRRHHPGGAIGQAAREEGSERDMDGNTAGDDTDVETDGSTGSSSIRGSADGGHQLPLALEKLDALLIAAREVDALD